MVALGLACLAALPLLVVEVPPVLDWPAHFVRLSLLAETPLTPAHARFWETDLAVRPNLAMELVVLPLAKLLGVRAAYDAFVAATLALWIVGPMLLHRVVWGRWGAESLAAWAFALNACFFVGFYNFLFGAGLGFLLLAVAAMPRERPGWSFLLEALLFGALWLSHLMAFAVFAVLRVSLEIGRPRGDRPGSLLARLLAAALALAPATLLAVIFRESGGEAPISFNLLANLAAPFLYASRAGGLVDPLPVLAVAGLALWGWKAGRLAVAPVLRLPLLAVVVLMLVAPSEAFSGAMIHWRMAPILGALFVAAWKLDLEPRHLRRAGAVGLAFAIAAAILQTALWRRESAVATAARTALAAEVTPGARVLPVATRADALAHVHLAELAVVDDNAFVPTLFTTRGQSPLRLKPEMERIGATTAREGAVLTLPELGLLAGADDTVPPDLAARRRPYLHWPSNFDVVLITGPGAEVAEPPPCATRRAGGPHWSVLRVDRAERCGGRG